MSNEVLRDLITTGFSQTRHVQPWAWRYAKQLMGRQSRLQARAASKKRRNRNEKLRVFSQKMV